MSFYNTRFPDDVSYGSRGGPRFNTTILRMRSGHEQRNANWQYPLHEYNVSYGIRTDSQMATVRNFFMTMLGMVHTWRFKDWGDYATGSDNASHSSTDQYLSVYSSTVVSATVRYQLSKTYSISSAIFERTITKPVSATVSVAVQGVDYAMAACSVNYDTGVIKIGGQSAKTIAGIQQTNPCLVSVTTDSILSRAIAL